MKPRAASAIESRRDEFAVRLVQGARWWRLARQQAGEHLITGALAGVGGIVVANGALHLLTRLRILPSVEAGPYTMALVTGLALTAPCGAWAVSAIRMRRLEASGRLHSLAARHGATTRSVLTPVFLALQIALSLALVCGALLFVDNLRNRIRIDPGFDAEGVQRTRISLGEAAGDETTTGVLRRALVREAASLPGIVDASWGS